MDKTRNLSRNRRGVLNIIGEISHTLFGTATDTSVSELRRIVQQTRVNQGRVRHRVQEMISILNQTYDNIEENRNRINDITSFIQTTITNIKELYVEQDHNKKVVRKLRVEFEMETSLRSLEDRCQEYLHTVSQFKERKAALEAGRLTESLLSMDQLRDVLAQETTTGVVPIHPLQWYYEYSIAEPVWDNEYLLYRVRLPLVEDINYITYQLSSWPMPWNKTGYSSQVEVQLLLG